MEQTKITLKIYEPFLQEFNKQIDSVFIKRDALLNQVLKIEVSYLAIELQGKVLSSKARRCISGELKRLPTKTINVVVDKEVALNLKSVTSQCNLVRDAFMNRLIMFLLSRDRLLTWLKLPLTLSREEFEPGSYFDDVPTSPLGAVKYTLSDPLCHLRRAAKQRFDTGLYLIGLPNEFVGFTCYLEDEYIPGTLEYKKFTEEMANLLDDLEFGFVKNSSKEAQK